MGLSKKNRHAELVSLRRLRTASTLYVAYSFRNEFGMTLYSKLIGQPRFREPDRNFVASSTTVFHSFWTTPWHFFIGRFQIIFRFALGCVLLLTDSEISSE